jgi:hypothetical protein
MCLKVQWKCRHSRQEFPPVIVLLKEIRSTLMVKALTVEPCSRMYWRLFASL